MANKKTPGKDKADQTRSETTAAAQTLFNLPQQPQSPVTADNLAATVNKAVQTAFAQQERSEMTGLKKVTGNKKPTTSPKRAVSSPAERPKPGTKKVSDDDLLNALLKQSSIRAALRSVGLHETSQGSRERAKKILYSHAQTLMADKPDTPAKKKLKVRLKVPAADNVPDIPRKKPKVRLKPRPGMPQPQETQTPTGAAISQIADEIHAAVESNVPAATKPKVKFKGTVPTRTINDPTPPSQPPATQTTEKTQIVNSTPEATKAVHVFNENSKLQRISASEPDTDVEALKARLDKLDEERKAQKVAPKVSMLQSSKADRAIAREEAEAALNAFGFKKGELKKILDQVDHIDRTQDKVLYALKLLDPENGKHVKIPKPELPAAIEQAKSESGDKIVAAAPKKPEASTQSTPPPQEGEDMIDSKDLFSAAPTPKTEAQTTAPTSTTAPTGATAQSSDTELLHLISAQVNALKNYVVRRDQAKDSDQKKIEDENKEEAKRRADEARQKDINKKLDAMYKKLTTKGLFDLLAEGLVTLIGGLIGPVSLAIAGVLTAIYVFRDKVMDGITWVMNKLGYTGENLSRKASDLMNGGAEPTAQEEQYKDRNNYATSKGVLNNVLKGTGYTAISASKYTDQNGATVDYKDLPQEIKEKLARRGHNEPKADTTAPKTESVAPAPKSSAATSSLSNAPDLEPAQDAPAPVIVQQDNSVTQTAPQADTGGTLIKVRNDEPSAGGLISSLFDHPASYGGVYRM